MPRSICLAAAVAAMLPLTAWADALVVIHVEPKEVQILVDGALKGDHSPLAVTGLAAGKHTVEVRKAGMVGELRSFEIGDGVTEKLEFALAPEYAGTPAPKPEGCDACPEMLRIPGGKFTMGSDGKAQADEAPPREVKVPPFNLGKYEVSVAEFRVFVKETRRTIGEGKWERPFVQYGYEQAPDEPVVYVSYEDAQAYVNWLNLRHKGKPYRLPSEAEWEYAARAGTITERFWGDDANAACLYANVGDRTAKAKFPNLEIHECDDGYLYTAPRNAPLKPNRFGLAHMLGNVWEWAADCYHDSYRGAPAGAEAWDGGANCAGGRRVIRGGSWYSRPVYVRSAARYRIAPGGRDNDLGFRLAQDL